MDEFSPPQRLFLTTVCAFFHTTGEWPTYGWLDRELMEHDDCDVEEVGHTLESFMYDSPYAPVAYWDPTRVASLSITAIQRCSVDAICPELSEDLDAFVQALLICVRKHIAGDDPVRITASELRETFAWTDLTLRKVFRLLETASFFGGSSGINQVNTEKPVDWTFTASPSVRRYRKAASLDDYLSIRQKLIAASLGPVDPMLGFPSAMTYQRTHNPDGIVTLAGEPAQHSDETTHSDQQAQDKQYKYEVAISFAGPERPLAERLANLITRSGYTVFYDNFYPDHLWGKDLPAFFDEVYREKSRYCVLFISQEYENRMWTTWERRSATTRLLQERGKEYVLPIRVENIEITGIPSTIGYLSLDQYPIDEIAEILLKKLRQSRHMDDTQPVTSLLATTDAPKIPHPGSRFSADAKRVLEYLVLKHDPEEFVGYDTVAVGVGLRGQDLDDALAELNDHAVIKPLAESSNSFSMVQPLAPAWLQVGDEVLDFDVHDDMHRVARVVNDRSQLDGPMLAQETSLPPRRVNIAVLALQSRRQIEVLRTLGTFPFMFAQASSNHRMRLFLKGKQHKQQ